jgi:predicted CoA-binding protein
MPCIAVIGASADRSKFGNKCVRAYQRRGWTVHPVHPELDTIEGCDVLRSVRETPTPLDRIAMYLPPTVGLEVLPEIAAVEHGDLIVNPGAESAELLSRARSLGLSPRLSCAILEIGESPATL